MPLPLEVWRIVKFGAVGGAATLTHLLVFSIAMAMGSTALEANTGAFCLALAVTFAGNRLWVFEVSIVQACMLVRFAVTSAVGFALNSVFATLTVDTLKVAYLYALIPMATITPAVTFLGYRFWVFNAGTSDRASLR
ncbi:MAG: GtrA family protein [Pseudomonadota bacterium]